MNNPELVRLKNISAKEFALWGIQDIAYIRPVTIEGQKAYAVHAADGTQVAVMNTPEVAAAAVRQNDLEPLSVH
ncbi:MAG: DUF1150 family protein [Alphaproteobacteria bacterium]|nr:DUF1150 family protein [Alphaproteobacteria bacterium]MDE1968044.1 DUF1150 family protein [Alphaproteobacteria bacterium]MDE2512973.1 DUF1150 family protein [Alphaproteobacteria bacterium]